MRIKIKVLLPIFIICLVSTAFSQRVTVTAENANLRIAPSMNGKVVDTVEQGTFLDVLKKRGNWFQVRSGQLMGWIHADTIDLEIISTLPSRENSSASRSGTDDRINTKPLYDFADQVFAIVNNRADPTKAFQLSVNAVVGEDGLLDKEKSVFEQSQGDPEMIELGKKAIVAVGGSGWLSYFQDDGANLITITLGQDADAFSLALIANYKDTNRAKRNASGLRGLVVAALVANKTGLKPLKDDEVELLKALKISNEGNLVKLSGSLDKSIAHRIIQDLLVGYRDGKIDAQAKPTQQ